LSEARQALADAEERQQAAAQALERRERELGRHSRDAVEIAVRDAREAIAAIVRDAQRAGTARGAAEAREALAAAAADAIARLPKAPPKPVGEAPPSLEPGARVFVPSMGATGVVARAPDARGRVKVTVGALTVEIDAAVLQKGAGGGSAPKRPAHAGGPVRGEVRDELTVVIQNATNTLDLRGQRADEALRAVEAFLDRSALEGTSPIIIVHGHGTGALRKEVRAYLADSPYVARWVPGEPRQGGDGVSIVELR
jgi:DNA mismatch repair protein MutS2